MSFCVVDMVVPKLIIMHYSHIPVPATSRYCARSRDEDEESVNRYKYPQIMPCTRNSLPYVSVPFPPASLPPVVDMTIQCSTQYIQHRFMPQHSAIMAT